MEVKIIKNEKSKWEFPCKGIRRGDGLIVGFQKYGEGTILKSPNDRIYLFYHSKDWVMDEFEPIEEEKQPIDWEKIEFPIWARDSDGNLIQITSIKGAELKYRRISNEMGLITDMFPTQGFAKEWLNSLEILPKGTKIEITI